MNTFYVSTVSQPLRNIERKMLEAFNLPPLTHYQSEVLIELTGMKSEIKGQPA